jgi:hypothetical protein
MLVPTTDQEKYIKYLTEFNSKINSVITKQISYLSKNSRIPIAIFIRPDLAEQMLQYSFPEDKEKREYQLSKFAVEQIPICQIYGMPAYINIKLSKSAAMVVGEIEWK